MWHPKREICRECNDIIGSAKGSQISEKFWSEVGKGKRADVYLEVNRRRGGIYFFNEASACVTTFCMIYAHFNIVVYLCLLDANIGTPLIFTPVVSFNNQFLSPYTGYCYYLVYCRVQLICRKLGYQKRSTKRKPCLFFICSTQGIYWRNKTSCQK